MKFIILLTIVTIAQSTPLGWNPIGNLYGWQGAAGNGWSRNLTPAQRASQQIQQQFEQINTPTTVQESVAVAQATAKNVVEQALQGRQRQTVAGINQLQRNFAQQGGVQSVDQEMATQEAISKLQNQLQLLVPEIVGNSQLGRTLEAVIQSQIVSNNVDAQSGGRSIHLPGLNNQIFQFRVQQLIGINNVREIELEIVRQQVIINQLREQQQLIQQQRELIQMQNYVEGQFSELQQVQDQLRVQEEQLVKQQLARQMVTEQLQQALVDQQQQLQQEIVGEQVQQQRIESWTPTGRRSNVGQWGGKVYGTVNRTPSWISGIWIPRADRQTYQGWV